MYEPWTCCVNLLTCILLKITNYISQHNTFSSIWDLVQMIKPFSFWQITKVFNKGFLYNGRLKASIQLMTAKVIKCGNPPAPKQYRVAIFLSLISFWYRYICTYTVVAGHCPTVILDLSDPQEHLNQQGIFLCPAFVMLLFIVASHTCTASANGADK